MSYRQADPFVKVNFGGWGRYVAAIVMVYPAFMAGQWLTNQL